MVTWLQCSTVLSFNRNIKGYRKIFLVTNTFKWLHMTEKDHIDQILSILSKDFKIRTEWEGKCFGKNVRIDALIKPIENEMWANKEIVFGVELKKEFKATGLNEVTDHIKQAIDYSYAEWKGVGRIPILICPGISYTGYANENGESVIKHLLSRFAIGELKQTHRGLAIVMADSHFIWDQTSGICEGKRWTFKTSIGCK